MDNLFKSSTNATLDSQFTEEDVATFLAAPLPTGNQVGLISGQTTSQIQGQDMATNYDPFINQLINDPPMFQGLGISNEYNTSSQVEERARIDMGIPNTQIMTTERSALPPLQNDRTINSHEEWNPRWFTQSQVALPNGRWERVVGPVQLSRPEQPMGVGIQTHQIPPANANRTTTQLERAIVPESSSARAPTNLTLNIGNQNATPMVSSAGPSNTIIPQLNQRQNLQIGRELWREEPNEAARNFILREGRVERPWDGRRLELGEGSSSKRQRTNSPPRQGPNTGLALQQPNNAPENQGVQQILQNQNNNPANHHVEIMSNSLYDPIYEALGLAIDPHIRFFEARNGRTEKGYYLFK